MNRSLRAEAVSFAYEKDEAVLRAVDAQVEAGVMTGIVGPNGCGKSTLLRLLCGLLRPLSGEILLDGAALARLSGRARARRVAFLPQAINPAFDMPVFEVACLGRYPHAGLFGGLGPKDFEVARRCLEETGTDTLRTREFLSLSGGERQRVLLASILAQEPDLLLLDEPTSALDIHHEVEVFSLLRRLVRQGYGVGVVTHDLNAAAQYCDTLILLGASHTVVAAGTPEEVLCEAALCEAYGASIRVGRHPFAGTPFVDALPEKGADA